MASMKHRMGRLGIRAACSFMAIALLAAGCRRGADPKGQDDDATAAISQARLLVERDVVEPGTVVNVGIMIELADGWHTYADPPGDSGMAPRLTMNLPESMQAGTMKYPPHDEFTDAAGTTYGYEEQVLLIVPVHVAADTDTRGELPIEATLDYLVCKEVCVPQRAEMSARLQLGSAASAPSTEWQRAAGGWMDGEGVGADEKGE